MKYMNIEIDQKDLVHNGLKLGAGLAKVEINGIGVRVARSWQKVKNDKYPTNEQ